jgi:hypothetical protein
MNELLQKLNIRQRDGIFYDADETPLGLSTATALRELKRRMTPCEWLRNFPELRTRQRRHSCTLIADEIPAI